MSTAQIALLFLFNALLMPLVVELVKERGAGLALRGIRLAVRLLPRAHRDRYREEWTAELDAMERQNVSQLVSSLRILLGAPSMGWVLRVRDRRQLLVEGGRERLTEGGKARKIFITLLAGALTYFITNLSEQPQLWVITVAVFIGGTTLIVQFMSDFENRLESIEEKQETHLTEIRSLVEDGFAKMSEATALKELGEGGQVSCDGEDRDWILGLTIQSRVTIDATSLSMVDAGGKSCDGGLWTSDLGQRYLELQREAMHRGVVIRRIFILDNSRLTMESGFLRIYRRQRDLGIHTRILDQSTIPHDLKNLLSEFIVFDGVISYEVPSAPHGMQPATVKTHLVLQPDRVQERMRQFEVCWSAALDIY